MAMREDLRSPVEHRDGDSGFTLTELLVSMAIFAIVITVFMGAMVSITHATARAQEVANAGDSVRMAFQMLDRQIRYAEAINSPGVGSSGAHYFEFLTSAQRDGELPLCTQWRFDPVEGTLAYRTWRDVTVGTVSDWREVADWMRNDLSGATPRTPFTLLSTGGSRTRQELVVSFDAGRTPTSEAGADVATSFVARNSSAGSITNDNNKDGVSDAFVCTSHLGRP